MPTYAYKCMKCDTKYEVFHKTQEVKENINCPSCGSQESKRLITAAGISGFAASVSTTDLPPAPSCPGGTCGVNFN